VRLQVRGVDHQLIRLVALGCEACKYLGKNAHPAPANEPIVTRLVWAIILWRVTPTQSIADRKNDAATDPTVIDARHAMRQGKIRLNLAHLRIGQPNQIPYGNASLASPLNQAHPTYKTISIDPEHSKSRLGG
jgi:hypothetical protein